jgi:hypothetical protein
LLSALGVVPGRLRGRKDVFVQRKAREARLEVGSARGLMLFLHDVEGDEELLPDLSRELGSAS